MARRPRFSERIGAAPARVQFQTDSAGNVLRNRLFNCVLEHYPLFEHECYLTKAGRSVWCDFFGESLVTSVHADKLRQRLADVLDVSSTWFVIYDLIEFVAGRLGSYPPSYDREASFIADCNEVLEQELSGFRFIEGTLTRVTSEREVAAVEAGLAHRLPAAREHLRKALEHLGTRPDAQCEASIHEALKAVEAQARDLAGMPSATLGAALKALKAKHQWHAASLEAFEKQYGWASDDGGVRHAFKGHEPDLALAKYMLITCSAFVNYLEELRGK